MRSRLINIPMVFSIMVPWPVVLCAPLEFEGPIGVFYGFADGASSVVAADIDRDGHLDLVLGTAGGNPPPSLPTVTWYENDGSQIPGFDRRPIIEQSLSAFRSVQVADLNGDAHIDVLSGDSRKNSIVWYENNGTEPPLFSPHTVTTAADGVGSVVVADLDSDGDTDILSASHRDDMIAWYENTGTASPSFIMHLITNEALNARSVLACDINGDDRMDVISASLDDNTVAWYENDGNAPPNFMKHVISSTTDRGFYIVAADLDGDKDDDVLVAEDDAIKWFENNGENPPGFTQHVIVTDIAGAGSPFPVVHVADLDNDGDMDVIGSNHNKVTIEWYENNGDQPPGFISHEVGSGEVWTSDIFAADLDDDGDLDVIYTFFLTPGHNQGALLWYRNLLNDESGMQGGSWLLYQ